MSRLSFSSAFETLDEFRYVRSFSDGLEHKPSFAVIDGDRRWLETDSPMNKTSRPEIMSRLLVGTQVLTSAAIVLSTRPSLEHPIGLAIAAVGIAMGVWAIVAMGVRRVSVMPELKSNAQLTTTGPYRLVRHPMYTALLLFAGGLAFSPFLIWKAIVWSILLAVLISKTVIEERQLRERFPEYEHYAKRTKRLVPFLV